MLGSSYVKWGPNQIFEAVIHIFEEVNHIFEAANHICDKSAIILLFEVRSKTIKHVKMMKKYLSSDLDYRFKSSTSIKEAKDVVLTFSPFLLQ